MKVSIQKSKLLTIQDLRLTKMMLTIFISFLVCFLPLMLVNVVDDDVAFPAVHIIARLIDICIYTYNTVFNTYLCSNQFN